MVLITIEGKFTRVYLRTCRWCKKFFYDHKPNKLYCSSKHQYWALRNSKNKYDRNYYRKRKKELILQCKGTVRSRKKVNRPLTYLGVVIPGSEWIDEMLEVEKMKKKTFSGRIYRGKKNDTPNSGVSSLQSHQYITLDDLYEFSISYLKEQNIKCPECSDRTNEISHGLAICRGCGLILKAPPVHPGFEVDDLVPEWKMAPTVQDLNHVKAKNSSKVMEKACKLAKSHYWKQVGVLDPEIDDVPFEDLELGEDWRAAWKYYHKKISKV